MTPAVANDLPIGRPFDCAFGPFVPRLTFLSASALQLDIPTPNGTVTQTVPFEATRIGPSMVLLSWAESDGTVVVHLQDYGTLQVASHARLADGTLMRSVGTIAWAT